MAKKKAAPAKRTKGRARSKVAVAKGVKESRKKVAKARKKPGGSNVGEYKSVKKGAFCGPAGGAPEGSYPVNTKKRARAALSYAHNAPNPEGIRRCVKKKFPSVGKIRSKAKKK